MNKELIDIAIKCADFEKPDLHSFKEAAHELSLAVLANALDSGCRDVLRQCCQHPVFDGDVASKSARDTLCDMGLVVKCANHGEFGFQIATYNGLYVQKLLS